MADERDDLIYDDEGNGYTPEQVRAAAEQMARDEAGKGSMGGLAEDDEGSMLSTRDPNASIDDQVARIRRGGAQAPERELNPANFGDFIRSNVFGGLDGKYITGKRPMTLFDYATDVLSAYGGADLGARNARLRKTALDEGMAGLQAGKYEQDIRSGQARQKKDEASTRKTNLEASNLAKEAIASVFQDVDSDLWDTRLREIEKEFGVQIPKSTRAMVTRWMEKAREIGVENPQEVLDNPDAYDEGFVNRTRHTFRLIEKSVQEAQTRQAELEGKQSATGIAQAKEGREQETSDITQSGTMDALRQLEPDLQSSDPAVRSRAQARRAALLQGGTTAQQVLADMAGVGSGGESGRNLAEKGYIERAKEALGPSATPGQVATKVAELKQEDAANKEGLVRGRRILADKEAAVAQGIATLDQMANEIERLSPGESGVGGRLYTAIRQKGGRLIGDPQTAVIDSLAGDMVNVARTLGGEKGPLTEGDVARIEQAIAFRDTDTLESWKARYEKAKRVAQAGLDAIRQAMRSGLDTPPKIPSSRVIQMLGDEQDTSAPTASGGSSRQEAARQALQKAQAITDPAERKRFLAAERDRIKGMQ